MCTYCLKGSLSYIFVDTHDDSDDSDNDVPLSHIAQQLKGVLSIRHFTDFLCKIIAMKGLQWVDNALLFLSTFISFTGSHSKLVCTLSICICVDETNNTLY